MASIEQLSAALIKADAAGNADDARALAGEIRKMQAAPAPAQQGVLSQVGQSLGDVAAGALRGFGSIGTTISGLTIDPLARATGLDKTGVGEVLGLGKTMKERRQGMDAGLANLGANTDSNSYTVGRIGGEVAGTLGAGPALGLGAKAAGVAAPLANALASSGMSTGVTVAKGAMPYAQNMLTRVAGGAAAGGVGAGMTDTANAGAGAVIGGAMPVAMSVAAKTGNTLAALAKPFFSAGQNQAAGKILRTFASNPESARANLSNAVEIVPGSSPTAAAAAGDDGLAALSRAMQNASPEYASNLSARQTAQNQARTSAMEGIAGNTGKIDIAEQARDALTRPMRERVLADAGMVPSNNILSSIDKLIAHPENAGKLSQDALNQFRGRISQFSNNGSIDARSLYAIRKDINDVLSGKLQGESGNIRYASGQLNNVKGLIDDAIDQSSRLIKNPDMPLLGNSQLLLGNAPNPQARPSWRGYLQTYANESIPINQMKTLDEILKSIQTGTVDSQGSAILSGAKLNNLLKNQGDDLSKKLSLEQLQILRNIQGDLNAGQIANNTGRAIGSNTLQNIAQNGILTEALGSTLGNSTVSTAGLGRLLQLPYGTANKQIQERLGNALLNPQQASKLMENVPVNKLFEMTNFPSALTFKAAPVIISR